MDDDAFTVRGDESGRPGEIMANERCGNGKNVSGNWSCNPDIKQRASSQDRRFHFDKRAEGTHRRERYGYEIGQRGLYTVPSAGDVMPHLVGGQYCQDRERID